MTRNYKNKPIAHVNQVKINECKMHALCKIL